MAGGDDSLLWGDFTVGLNTQYEVRDKRVRDLGLTD